MPRPNLLFLFTDEQRFDTLGAYGNRRIETPNLDALATRSTLFERAYVTQPVCTPSRASIMTGLTPHTNGCLENNVPLDLDIPTLAEMLPEDYACGYYGKWHLGDELFAQHGFAHWRSTEDGYHRWYRPGRDRDKLSDYSRWLLEQGYRPADGRAFARREAAELPERLSKPRFLAGEAEQFLRDHAAGPFCLYVNFLEPHMPFYGPRNEQYSPEDVGLPGSFECPPTSDQHPKLRMFHDHYRRAGFEGVDLTGPDGWRTIRRRYWGMCSQVDEAVGHILGTLEQLGLDENTIVVYTSDHGDMMGAHQLLAKCVMFEDAVRVPLLMSLPAQRTARRVSGPVSQLDLVPTLLEAMDAQTEATLEGKSLLPELEGRRDGDEAVCIEWNGPNCGIAADVIGEVVLPERIEREYGRDAAVAAITDPLRTVVTRDGWKLNASPAGWHELYDMNADPHECRNRCGEDGMGEKARTLAEHIRAWQEHTEDAVDFSV